MPERSFSRIMSQNHTTQKAGRNSTPQHSRRVKAVVFDCDGVMFDTSKANIAYYNHLLHHFNRPAMDERQIAFAQMHTVHESIVHLFGDDAQLNEAVNAFRMQMPYEPFLKKMEMEPDLIPLLRRLRPEFRTAVATNRTDTIERVLVEFGIDQYFDFVACALDVQHPKPHPDMLNIVLGHFGILPEQAVYVGDSELDQIAAQSAGVHFIAYGNRSLTAGCHIQRLGEVETFLNP